MFSKIKNALIKGKRKLLTTVAASFMTVTALAVSASAAESGGGTTPAGSGMAQIVNTAGTTLTAEFSNLVNALVPLLIGIALVGLGLYAVIYLFKMAKKFFAQAAG